MKQNIIDHLKSELINTLQWARLRYDIPPLHLTCVYSFDVNNQQSYVLYKRGNLFKFFCHFSLLDSLELGYDTDIFVECVRSILKDPIIGNKEGDGFYHCSRIIAHEVAHIVELIASEEPLTGTCIQQQLNQNSSNNRRVKHNNLWKLIYRDILSNYQESFKYSSVLIDTSCGFQLSLL